MEFSVKSENMIISYIYIREIPCGDDGSNQICIFVDITLPDIISVCKIGIEKLSLINERKERFLLIIQNNTKTYILFVK